MNELVETFVKARFEKKANPPAQEPPRALLDRLSGAPRRMYEIEQVQQSPELQKIRRAIERSIKTEKSLRERVEAAGRYAERAAITPAPPTATEHLMGAFPYVGAGAGVGTYLGSMWTPQRAQSALGGLSKDVVERIATAARLAPGVNPATLAEALGGGRISRALSHVPLIRHIPILNRLAGTKLSTLPAATATTIRRLHGAAGDPARKMLEGALASAKTPTRVGNPWAGAGLGALVGLSPALLSYYLRYRKGRKLGGVRALEAHEAARDLARKAEMLRRWRQAQLAQLQGGVAPSVVPFEEFLRHAPRVKFPTTP